MARLKTKIWLRTGGHIRFDPDRCDDGPGHGSCDCERCVYEVMTPEDFEFGTLLLPRLRWWLSELLIPRWFVHWRIDRRARRDMRNGNAVAPPWAR